MGHIMMPHLKSPLFFRSYVGSEATVVTLTDGVALINKTSDTVFSLAGLPFYRMTSEGSESLFRHFLNRRSGMLQRPFKLQYLKHDGLLDHFPPAQRSLFYAQHVL